MTRAFEIGKKCERPFSGRPQGGARCVIRRKTRPCGPPLKGQSTQFALFPKTLRPVHTDRSFGNRRYAGIRRLPARAGEAGKKCHRTPKLFYSRGRKPRSAVFFARKPGLPPPAIKEFDAGCIFSQPRRPMSRSSRSTKQRPGGRGIVDSRASVSSFSHLTFEHSFVIRISSFEFSRTNS